MIISKENKEYDSLKNELNFLLNKKMNKNVISKNFLTFNNENIENVEELVNARDQAILSSKKFKSNKNFKSAKFKKE
jgi:hypothetical protein